MTPKSMWIMPRITDIFILNELRKASLLLAIFQICGKKNNESAKHRVKGKQKRMEMFHLS